MAINVITPIAAIIPAKIPPRATFDKPVFSIKDCMYLTLSFKNSTVFVAFQMNGAAIKPAKTTAEVMRTIFPQ